MNCPSCGAPMHAEQDAFRCDYCRTIFVPEKNDDGVRILDSVADEACPTCSRPLSHATLVHMAILYCGQCCGMLIPMPIFETLIGLVAGELSGSAIEPPASGRDLNRKAVCPQCNRTMDTHFYAGPGNVVLDSCEHCNLIWLDHGELKRIARASGDHEFSTASF